jgi:hypothetical protein
MRAPAILISVLAACASSNPEVPPVRFANAPPVTVVNDRQNVPNKPAMRTFVRLYWHVEGSLRRPVTRALEVPQRHRALGVNALDEVPDSTWFTNRISARSVSPAEIAAAPGGIGSPEAYKPWTVISTKSGGVTVGFVIRDRRGEKWLLKFDRRGVPEAETAAQLIVGKLLWTLGYNVTEDYIVDIQRGDLVLSPKAVEKEPFGPPRRLTRQLFDVKLEYAEVAPDGGYRCLVSRLLPGTPIGGHPSEGIRKDDPNDLIPHKRRSDLRGASTIFAWVDYQDVQEGNYLDMYVADPVDPSTHYVKHYLLDYGQSLGVMGATSKNPRTSYEYYADLGRMAGSFLTLGLKPRPWEKRELVGLRGVGAFDAETFDPHHWRPTTPSYIPMQVADRFDEFWGAKLVLEMTREQIAAAVAAGRLTDPRASTYLVDALVGRQRKLALDAFSRVAPIDEPRVVAGDLCFADLSLKYKLVRPGILTSYTLETFDRDGRRFGQTRSVLPGPTGYTCTQVPMDDRGDGYTIVRITIGRTAHAGTTYVHVARDPATHAARVVGIWRP